MSTLHFSASPTWAIKASVAAILLFLPLGYFMQQALSEKQQYHQMFDAVQTKLQAHRAAAEKIRLSQKAFHRQLPGAEKSTPDLLPLQLLGKAMRDDVALVSLEIDNSQHQARLTVVADSLNSLLDFTARLQNVTNKVELESHATEAAPKGRWKVKASLSVEFRHED
ncbi:hypothetical protein ITX54_23400 [Rouxiella silvae]|uniref:Uncharacterized protein n=1 Tax=Rouxiella silvae TaxID=1646373 RepID=A0AA40X6K4_9GAMM|nr:hypothetical protein [Rouxiella silvae]MBF6639618.1 hypothetical protein [Rouxiella silvae]